MSPFKSQMIINICVSDSTSRYGHFITEIKQKSKITIYSLHNSSTGLSTVFVKYNIMFFPLLHSFKADWQIMLLLWCWGPRQLYNAATTVKFSHSLSKALGMKNIYKNEIIVNFSLSFWLGQAERILPSQMGFTVNLEPFQSLNPSVFQSSYKNVTNAIGGQTAWTPNI